MYTKSQVVDSVKRILNTFWQAAVATFMVQWGLSPESFTLDLIPIAVGSGAAGLVAVKEFIIKTWGPKSIEEREPKSPEDEK